MEPEHVWEVTEGERALALLEKLGERRNVLAWRMPPELLSALARRSRALLATNDREVVFGLPAGGFSLIAAGADVTFEELESLLRLRSPAALVALCGSFAAAPRGLVPFQRVGAITVCRPATALPSRPATVRP